MKLPEWMRVSYTTEGGERVTDSIRVTTPAETEQEMRSIQHTYATRHGYFWLPCPLCGRDFGGHEWFDIGDLPSTVYPDAADPGAGVGICPVCTAQGRGVTADGAWAE